AIQPANVRRETTAQSTRKRREVEPWPNASGATGRLIATLAEVETRGGEAVVDLSGGGALAVGHLDKVFWPGLGITKGALLRYYAWAAPRILPAVADRPVVMRRFPDGVRGKAFYQQRAPADTPPGVRVDTLPVDTEVPSRLIGGSLMTLLYMAQIAAISQDPWFSRVGSLDDADHVARGPRGRRSPRLHADDATRARAARRRSVGGAGRVARRRPQRDPRSVRTPPPASREEARLVASRVCWAR